MDASGRVGEHLEAVVLGEAGVLGDTKRLLLGPHLLPLGLDLLVVVVLLRHAANLTHRRKAGQATGLSSAPSPKIRCFMHL